MIVYNVSNNVKRTSYRKYSNVMAKWIHCDAHIVQFSGVTILNARASIGLGAVHV